MIAAACRRASIASRQLDPIERLTQLVMALETAVSAGEDGIQAVMARRASHLYAAGRSRTQLETTLRAAYRIRSKCVHKSAGLDDLDEAAESQFVTVKVLGDVLRQTAAAWLDGRHSRSDHEAWLESKGAL